MCTLKQCPLNVCSCFKSLVHFKIKSFYILMLKLHVGYCNSVLFFVGHPWIRSASGKASPFALNFLIPTNRRNLSILNQCKWYLAGKQERQKKGRVNASAIRTPSSLSKCMHFGLRFQINVQHDSNGIWQGYLTSARQIYSYLQNI